MADDRPPALELELGRTRSDTWLVCGYAVCLLALAVFVGFVAWQVAELRALIEAARLCARP